MLFKVVCHVSSHGSLWCIVMTYGKKFVNSKYRNVKTMVDGIEFDSKKEARRYCELLLMQKGKQIMDLELQPKFDLMVNGTKCGYYKADFRYFCLERQQWIIEDVKSEATKTPVYRLKKKILATLNIHITEY